VTVTFHRLFSQPAANAYPIMEGSAPPAYNLGSQPNAPNAQGEIPVQAYAPAQYPAQAAYASPPAGYTPQNYAPQQGYPPQGYPPQGYAPQQGYPVQQGYPAQPMYGQQPQMPIMGTPYQQPPMAQPMMMIPPSQAISPTFVQCGNCGTQGMSVVRKENGGAWWGCCCLNCLCFGLIGVCAFFMCCADSYQDSHHFCPRCGAVLGVNQKSMC